MKIDEIKTIAKLAKIKLSPKEVKDLWKDLQKVLDYVAKLDKVDTKKAGLFFNSAVHKNVFRKDKNIVEAQEEIISILKQSPLRKGRFFKTKNIF